MLTSHQLHVHCAIFPLHGFLSLFVLERFIPVLSPPQLSISLVNTGNGCVNDAAADCCDMTDEI